jgi:hypothetical protein
MELLKELRPLELPGAESVLAVERVSPALAVT